MDARNNHILSQIAELRQQIKALESQLDDIDDVTQTSQKDIEANPYPIHEISQYEQQLQALLDMASVGYIIANSQGVIVRASQGISDMLDYTRDELEGAFIHILLPQHLRAKHEAHLKSFFANPNPRPMGQGMDLVGQRRDGIQIPIEVSLSTIPTEEGILGVAFIVDISERKRLAMRTEEERSNALQSFLSDAAHDLKTPMAAMMMRLHIMNRKIGEAAIPHTSVLEKHIHRLNHLVNAMLVMARLDMIQHLEKQPVQINQLVSTTISSNSSAIDAKEHHLTHQLPETLPALMVNDEYLLIALKNIFNNAIIFTPNGGTIDVKTSLEDLYVCITISDTGIGISSEDIPHVFNRFYRTDTARQMTDSINGLGLAIARRIVELHQGKIKIESEVDRGSTVKILLPLEPLVSATEEDIGYMSSPQLSP